MTPLMPAHLLLRVQALLEHIRRFHQQQDAHRHHRKEEQRHQPPRAGIEHRARRQEEQQRDKRRADNEEGNGFCRKSDVHRIISPVFFMLSV